ncbi:DUF3618 domain-containing protein [Rhodococcus phenolicus]|uniref:DUF3618 domain-containing protein n=1 Tax=Rhodococcus phenolicus TaxID=263849 RepID=UPI00082E14CE|nr:DUF3618 domain-containing protein [Rhodococcus phenolicus]
MTEPDLERQRAELAATVGELTDRLDVPTRVRTAAERRVAAVRDRPGVVAAIGGAVAVAGAAVLMWRRRR